MAAAYTQKDFCMKNKTFSGCLSIMALIAGFVLVGCITYDVRADLGIFDVSTPMEEQCTLKIGTYPDRSRATLLQEVSNLTILTFDGEPVWWHWHAKIRIPAGRHTLSSSGNRSDSSYFTPYGASYTEVTTTTRSGKDTVVYTFEAGKTYQAGYGYNGLYIQEIK
jgi:hypothetical protein